jgi:phage shock protein B
MSDNLTALLGCFIVICVPVWLGLHYTSKARTTRHLNAQDAEAFENLSQTAARMEQRMIKLERILDAEVPNWRQNFGSSQS